jgi:very-short-patch-repair endonuclease
MTLLFPKPKKRTKVRKPLRRSRIKPGKNKFKAYGENPFKTYHRSRDEAETDRWAEDQAERRRSNPTEAEAAVEGILDQLGVAYIREKVWANGSHPIFSDFYLPDHKMTIECDGENHRADKVYDRRRSMWLARKHGVGTVRLWNRDCLNGKAALRLREMLGL